MKSKTTHCLSLALILTVSYLTSVQAVTDAELEALEKQIEQQEVDEKRKAEEEIKRKAVEKRLAEEETKRKAEEEKQLAEQEKQRQEEEQKILTEQKKIEEEKRKAEEARLAELEQQRQEDELVNSCSKIIGVWRWNDLMGTTTRFYEDGKVVSKNIFKSEGNWECINPENMKFTFNTWNKKRDIQIEDDYKKLHSVGVLGEKLIANKISDNPFE